MTKRSRSWETSSDLVAKWADWLKILNEHHAGLCSLQREHVALLTDDLEDLVAAAGVCLIDSEDVAIWTRVKRLDRKWANLKIGCPGVLIDSQSTIQFRSLLRELTGFFIEYGRNTNERSGGLFGLARRMLNWVMGYQEKTPKFLFPPTRHNSIEPDLPFVNRGQAMRQLLWALNELEKRKRLGYGTAWTIPVIDSPYGMGKTRVGLSFTEQLALNRDAIIEGMNDLADGLVDDLIESVTIHVEFDASQIALCGRDWSRLQKTVVEQILKGLHGGGIGCEEQIHVDPLVRLLVRKWRRGVFFVFDEVGRSCESDYLDARENFLHFTEHILLPLARMRLVHFVVLGRAQFMQTVGLRTAGCGILKSSPVTFVRVHLNPIRPEYIMELVKFKCKYREWDRCSLEAYSEKVYRITSGHPRSIADVLSLYPNDLSRASSVNNAWPLSDIRDVIIEYQEATRTLLHCHVCSLKFKNLHGSWNRFRLGDGAIDLTREIYDDVHKSPNYQQVANLIFAGYGSDLNETFIQIPPIVVNLIETVLFTLVEYCTRIINSQVKDFDYALVFEKILMKFFQSIFGNFSPPTCREILSTFIPIESCISSYRLRLQKEGYLAMPRILSESNSRSANTIARGDCVDSVSSCLRQTPSLILPFAKSHSPDVLLFPEAVETDGRLTRKCLDKKVLIGIAAKNYTTTKMNTSNIDDELNKFRKIIPQNTQNLQAVLLVCATSYSMELQERFSDTSDSFVYSVDTDTDRTIEVVVVRIDTPDRRRRFFGTASRDPRVLDIIESVIAKDPHGLGVLFNEERRLVQIMGS